MVAREDRRSNHRQLWTRSIFRFHYIQKAFIPLPIKVRIVELMLQSYVGIIPIHPGFGPTPVQSNVNTPKVNNNNIRQTESPTRDGRPSFMAFHEMIGRDGRFPKKAADQSVKFSLATENETAVTKKRPRAKGFKLIREEDRTCVGESGERWAYVTQLGLTFYKACD